MISWYEKLFCQKAKEEGLFIVHLKVRLYLDELMTIHELTQAKKLSRITIPQGSQIEWEFDLEKNFIELLDWAV